MPVSDIYNSIALLELCLHRTSMTGTEIHYDYTHYSHYMMIHYVRWNIDEVFDDVPVLRFSDRACTRTLREGDDVAETFRLSTYMQAKYRFLLLSISF